MDYPIWQLSTFAGGFWVAFIATVHVYVAQFAVGGGLFLVLSELQAYKKGTPHLLQYTQAHSKFFLLLTMVFGAVTGVGIWVTVALLSPLVTSTLVHTFVFAWAAEWVCFLGEIIALLCYYYGWKKLNRRDHLRMGWLYFIFAWLSLFLINGIITFMLTPGAWLETHNFWDGFFNPSFWSSLVFRTFLACMITGLFGFVTATRIAEQNAREHMIKSCAAWAVIPFFLLMLSGWWYFGSLPEPQYILMAETSQRAGSFLRLFLYFAPACMLGVLLLSIKTPKSIRFPLALLVLLLGLGMAGSFEFVREAGRKPYLIFNHTYSNSIAVEQQEEINQKGMLASSRWADAKLLEIDPKEAGRLLYQIECSACHSLHGVMNDLLPRTEKFSLDGMEAMLTGMGTLNSYMPPFLGTKKEKQTLARWIVEELHNKKTESSEAKLSILPEPEIPNFESSTHKYVLTAWADKGVTFFTDLDSQCILSSPSSTLKAQLILRGDPPMLVTENAVLEYRLEENQELAGEMILQEGIFTASNLPVTPYAENNQLFRPYPLVHITAKNIHGKFLAETRITAPVSTELGCKHCHGGQWKVADRAGVTRETVADVLAVHDRMNKTELQSLSASGLPVHCRSCHNQAGRLPSLSAALHGVHALYLAEREEDACAFCHPTGMQGATRAFRGRHADFATCLDCHGALEDHALSLLRHEQQRGASSAGKLINMITPRKAAATSEIEPRKAWEQEPDCLTCHKEYASPSFDAFNVWTKNSKELFAQRKDEMGALACAACHGSPHAIRPASNPYGDTRDAVIPLQYQANNGTLGTQGSCICHTVDYVPTDSMHHSIIEE